jgi:hypothetical protein
MSNYKEQEFDFIKRTKTILAQYDSFQIVEKDKYEVTLLINCLVGLLILPQQNWFDQLPTELTSQKEWGIKPEHISRMKSGETKNVKDIARHLRNSIAHYKFEDFDKTGVVTFEAILPIANLKQFVEKLSSLFSKEMEEEYKRNNPK